MFEIVNRERAYAAERRAAEEFRLNTDVLIEEAAEAIAGFVAARADKKDLIAAVVGGGNNAADALSMCRKLKLRGYSVEIFTVADKLNPYASDRLTAAMKLGVAVRRITSAESGLFRRYKIIVDGMFGLGFKGPATGVAAQVIERINEARKAGAFVLSVDLPSGLDVDTGVADKFTVCADATVTFNTLKFGQILLDGQDYCGDLTVANIGLSAVEEGEKCFALEAGDCVLPKRKSNSHKGVYGKVKIIAGCGDMPGAALMGLEASQAVLKSGGGTVTLGVPQSLMPAYRGQVKQQTLFAFDDGGDGRIRFDKDKIDAFLDGADSLAFGMGMDVNGKTEAEELLCLTEYVIKKYPMPVILDAGALTALAWSPDILKNAVSKVILTPHPGEFKRLTDGAGIEYKESDGLYAAKAFAARFGVTVILKTNASVITDGKRTFINLNGTPALAKAGSGDILSGILAALAAREHRSGGDLLKAAAIACYRLSEAGAKAAKRVGENGVTADCVLENLRV